MKTKSTKQAFASVLCAATLAAPASFAAQPSAAPCELLTPAQISSAAGVAVGTGTPIATTGCTWSGHRFMTTLSIRDAGSWEKMKAPQPGMTKMPVPALGDDAYFMVLGEKIETGGMATLTVRKGPVAYVFKVYTRVRSVPEQVAIEKSLATDVLATL